MERDSEERHRHKREVRGHVDGDGEAPVDDVISNDELYASCTSICKLHTQVYHVNDACFCGDVDMRRQTINQAFVRQMPRRCT